MPKSGLVLVIILASLAVLLLGGTMILGFNLSDISSELLNGIGATLSAMLLALILVMDLMFVVLIARTPNRWWQP